MKLITVAKRFRQHAPGFIENEYLGFPIPGSVDYSSYCASMASTINLFTRLLVLSYSCSQKLEISGANMV
jgi:hypothetical protein